MHKTALITVLGRWFFGLKKRLVVCLAALSLTTLAVAAEKSRKPNIVFILADDLGWKDTSLYGSKYYETPNICRLAKRGMMFMQAYAASPLCSPTRASIMTGLYPARIGITVPVCHVKEEILKSTLQERAGSKSKILNAISATRLLQEYFTLAEALKEAGYATGHFGKWHLGPEPYDPLHQGFDVDVPHTSGPGPAGSYIAPWKFPANLNFQGEPGEHIEDRMAQEAIKFIKENKDRPFFLNYWMFSVHSPWQGNPELVEKYADKAKPDSPQRNPIYGAMVESMDDNVGVIINTLDKLGIADNTIIIFFSDNGGVHFPAKGERPLTSLLEQERKYPDIPMTSNLPLRGGKATMYEGGTREPCIIVWPGTVKPNTKTDAMIQSIDFYPTILEMIGVQPKLDLKFDGKSFVPVLQGKGSGRDTIFCHFPHNVWVPDGFAAAYVRKGDLKLMKFFHDGPDFAHRYELYNLKDDIGETNNLAEKMLEKVKEIDALLENFLKESNAVIPKPNPYYIDAKMTDKIDFDFNTGQDGVGSGNQIENLRVENGILKGKSTGDDPILTRPNMEVDSNSVKKIRIRMKVDRGTQVRIFWCSKDSPNPVKERAAPAKLIADNEFHEYVFDVGSHELWKDKTITSIRIDPIEGATGGEFEIDYIKGE